ncbi:hypothetical protein HYPBUDRAFT_229722 [Hyphopichia burtonii NRRL Y-1933]|uniref:Uncharacterized protein n=1 Tax=Hyphopichia burtonii NRRL Y-1933 TaxID=984485 RepID=A0A1E4RCU9_9ASCO|nr:hypothetical protein HYPBUDRAFT_229722 [Hyphopichia burtonii NRRL Y-1933]ODV65082.1 hypothetical protein HYPBUDRAFT_229722 [Hyphopichia burtonii NRRL Y-1933]
MSYLKSLSFGEYYLGLFVLDSCHINTSDQVCLDNTLDHPSIPVFQWDFSIQMSRLQSDQLGRLHSLHSDQLGRLHSLHSDQLGSPHPDQLGNLGAANVESLGNSKPCSFLFNSQLRNCVEASKIASMGRRFRRARLVPEGTRGLFPWT